MLIILPPSESKRPAPPSGKRLVLNELSFPELTPMRRRVLNALVETSKRPEALERLLVGPSLVQEVAHNTLLRTLPTQPAIGLYAGALYEGLSPQTLSTRAVQRSASDLVIASALWGALRPSDQIPTYRLNVCSRLVGLDRLEPAWRTVLPAVLADAAGAHGVALDLRSPSYQAIGTPARLGVPTVTVRVLPEAGGRTIGNVIAKRIRGEVARYLLESHADPGGIDELADVFAERWPVRLDPPATGLGAWTIRLRPAD